MPVEQVIEAAAKAGDTNFHGFPFNNIISGFF
jgi:hypothetical protein